MLRWYLVLLAERLTAGNRVNVAHKGFLLIVDQNVPAEEDIQVFQTTDRAGTFAPQEGHRNVVMLDKNDDERDDMINNILHETGREKPKKLVILDVNGLLVDVVNNGNSKKRDDSPYKALRNLVSNDFFLLELMVAPFPIFVIPPLFFLFFKDNTAIFLEPYSYTNRDDNFLEKGFALQSYLEKLVDADSVPQYVKQSRIG
ncbi:hypothetical protein ACFE04_022501 [Oxalis oulophora]